MFVFTQAHKHTHPYQQSPGEEVIVAYHLLNFYFIGTSLGVKLPIYHLIRIAEDLSLPPIVNHLEPSGAVSGCISTGPEVVGL